MRMSDANHRDNLTRFIASLNQRVEAPTRNFSHREFTSAPELFAEIDFLCILGEGQLDSALLSLMNCHIALFESMLNVALKEVGEYSYLERLLRHDNAQVRYLGLQLTTAFLTRLTSSTPDELIERSMFVSEEERSEAAIIEQAVVNASQLAKLVRLSLSDSEVRISGFAKELAYSMIAASDEATLARPYREACAAELREYLPPRDASVPRALIARVVPPHARVDRSFMSSPWMSGHLSTAQIADMERMRDSKFFVLFPEESPEETDEDESGMRMSY